MRCAVTDSKSVVERGGTAPSSALAFAGAWVLRIFFFFSSRRRHTRYIGDWSSDVCSSDLFRALTRRAAQAVRPQELGYDFETAFLLAALTRGLRVQFVAVSTVYHGRPSHFRHWADTWRQARVFTRYARAIIFGAR